MADSYTYTHNVGAKTITVSTTKTLAAAGNYDANDVLSESATNGVGTDWDFVDIGKSLGSGGLITKATTLCSTTALTQRYALDLYTSAPTCELDDNAANSGVLAADKLNWVGRIEIPICTNIGGMSANLASTSTTGGLPLEFTCASGSRNLYGVLVTLDAVTEEAANMTLTITLAARYN